jgi:hypothetical protein
MSYMNIHTALDDVGRKIMNEQIGNKIKDLKVQDAFNASSGLNEFKNTIAKIKIRLRTGNSPAGEGAISHGAGLMEATKSPEPTLNIIGTVTYIHISLGDLEKLKNENNGKLIVTEHIASNSGAQIHLFRNLKKEACP